MTLSFEKKDLLRDDRGKILREAVEYSLVDHCNLRCAGCDHSSPHLPKRFADLNAFAADLEALSQHLHVRTLRLVGGEPLLHPELERFASVARETQIADQLMLWTNGLLLHKVSTCLLESFDIIHVSVYPGVTVQADLPSLARTLEVKGTRLTIAPVTRFQHQVLNDRVEDPRIVRRTYLRCKEAHSLSCHTVSNGRYYKCAKSALLEPRLASTGINVVNRPYDGIALHDNPNLASDLRRYLLSTEPLVACSWCLGTDGKSFRHHQLDQQALRAERCTGSKGPLPLAGPVRRLVRDLRDQVLSR